MSRHLLFCAPLALLAACSGRDMGSEWFPLRVGDEQTMSVSYQMDEPRDPEQWVMRVDEPVVFQDQPVAVRHHSAGVSYYLKVDDQGVRRIATRTDIDSEPTADAEPMWVLKAPYAVGTEWTTATVPYLLQRRNEHPRDLKYTHKVQMTWRIEAVDDMVTLARLASEENPGLPLVLMGHSMGAMFAQSFILDHSNLIDALVLSGTAAPGPRMPGGPNSVYKTPRTDYDWLSRAPAEVDAYIADPFCGIQFDADSAASFAALRERPASPDALAAVKPGLPIYIFVGDEDPINHRLERIHPLVANYRAANLPVDLKVYAGGRHEMLNETNRDEVVADLLAWLDATVDRLEASGLGAARPDLV